MSTGASATPKLIVGIDFGTTYSGVAWTTSMQPDRIIPIMNWDTVQSCRHEKHKVPSAISYPRWPHKVSWGFDAPCGTDSLQWFKLLLVDESDLQPNLQISPFVLAARRNLERLGKTAIGVIADYLRLLWKHSLKVIGRDLGNETLANLQLVISVTLPAIWPAYAQARMHQAVALAGILEDREAGSTVLRFISEPEAAALATMEDMERRPDTQVNDHIIVCDARGGTVDIITYMVVKTGPLSIRESIRGDGALCGSVFLDEAFKRLLRRKLPREVHKALGDQGIAAIMNNEWENGIKPGARDDQDVSINIPYYPGPGNPVHCPQVEIKGSEIKAIFGPVVSQIEGLVVSQLIELKRLFKKRPKYLILVGGFGKSDYLYIHLRRVVHREIEILQGSGERPWTAICRGAVINGLARATSAASVKVEGRVARASYGTRVEVCPWTATEHDVRDKMWCPTQQQYVAAEQVEWFLHIGEVVHPNKPVTHSYYQDLEKPEENFEADLVVCTEEDPPTRCSESVKALCKIRWSKAPNFEELPVYTNSVGQRIRRVHYEIKMTVESGSLDFAIYHNGVRMASQNVSVEFDLQSKGPRIQDNEPETSQTIQIDQP